MLINNAHLANYECNHNIFMCVLQLFVIIAKRLPVVHGYVIVLIVVYIIYCRNNNFVTDATSYC